MIKTFISHSATDDQFVNWLGTKLQNDFDQLDIFIDHWRTRVGEPTQNMIDEVKNSLFFIPILSNDYIERDFCVNEQNTAKQKKKIHEFPILLKIDQKKIPGDLKIKFKADDIVEGLLWCDFSIEKEWERNYELFVKSIFDKIASLDLLVKKEFYRDCEHIDMILKRDVPTSSEFKMMFNIYLERKEFQKYFFHNLDKLIWLKYLKIYGYLKNNPEAIKAEDSPEYFIPFWPILDYLEKMSFKIIKNPDDFEEYWPYLVEIIKEITEEKVDNLRTWWYFVKILVNIPNDKIPDEIIELIPIWLDSKFETMLQGAEITTKLLPKFLNDKSTQADISKAEKIINHIMEIKKVPLNRDKAKRYGKDEEFKFKLDSYWLKNYFDKNYKLIAEKCSNRVIENLIVKVKEILNKPEDGTHGSFYTDESIYEPLDLFTKVLKNILNEKAQRAPESIKNILEDFITSDLIYFQKMAIYVIGNNINCFKNILWKYIDKIIGDSVERQYFVGDELKHLLQNLQDLSDEQKELLKDKIEKGPIKDIPDKEEEKYKLRWKQKLCHALSHDVMFKDLYEELKQKTKEEAELTPGFVWLGMRYGREESLLSAEEMIQKSNEELANMFSEFKGKTFLEGPTVEGLSDMLKKVVKENPDKFLYNMNPFINSGYLYVHDILWGLKDAWKDKKRINWESLFKFIKDYIGQDKFWTGKLKVEGSYWNADYEWVLSQIGELIQEGTKDDSWAFDAELLPKAEEILFFIIEKFLENPPKEDKEETHDPVTHALNSAFGTIITAFLFLALRKTRIEEKKIKGGESRWSPELKNIYENLLNSQIGEAFTIFGQYMGNFIYLEKPWAISKIDDFAKLENPYWSNFMIGYLYCGKVYFDFYDLMKVHYKRAIHYSFKEKTAEDRLIQHITVLYLSDVDQLQNDSLIGLLIEKNKSSYIDGIVRYFRGQFQDLMKAVEQESKQSEKDKVAVIREKVISFWRALYQKYKDKDENEFTDDDKKILTDLLMLSISLPKIETEYFEWIKLSLSNPIEFYSSHLFIEDLNLLKNKGNLLETGKFIGEILLELVKKGLPTTFKENIKSIVHFLYEVQNPETKEFADEICNIYAERGVYDENGQLFLRDIYDKYNQS